MFSKLVEVYPDLQECAPQIQAAFDLLVRSFRVEGKLLICGNGGSAADSEHIVGELMKGFHLRRPVPDSVRDKLSSAFPEEGAYLADHLQGALPAISLVSHTALMTAFANDVSADTVFAQQVYGYGRPGDVLLALSTSGNSRNVLHALRVARVLDLYTIGLTGETGGAMSDLCDVTVCVPYHTVTDIQERHLAVYHALCTALEAEFFGEARQ